MRLYHKVIGRRNSEGAVAELPGRALRPAEVPVAGLPGLGARHSMAGWQSTTQRPWQLCQGDSLFVAKSPDSDGEKDDGIAEKDRSWQQNRVESKPAYDDVLKSVDGPSSWCEVTDRLECPAGDL